MKFKIESRSIWEFGQRKDSQGNPHQEDSIYPAYGRQTKNDRLFILCDGMGGHDAGEVASATVCETMSKVILAHDAQKFSKQELSDAIAAAYDALDEKDSGAEKKMGTTMTLLKLHEDGATIAHMGDSRVYHIRPGKDGASTCILFATEDHSLVNDLIKIGELTPEEAKVSRQKNVITRAMQPGGKRSKADVYETADIKPGDYFYMCSDGMLEQMEDDALRNIFSKSGGDIDKKVKILTGATTENKDNHTAILVHIKDVDNVKSPGANGNNHIGKKVDVPMERISNVSLDGVTEWLKSKLKKFLPIIIVVAIVGIAYVIAPAIFHSMAKVGNLITRLF
jgi:protein phosphatase